MDVKKLALLVGALVIAVITAVMAKNMFAGAGAQQAAAATAFRLGPKVLVAKKALPVGTIIDADSFTFQPWPKELMQSAYYVEGQPDGDPKKLLGTVVRYPITAGQPVTRGSLVGPQDRGFLAAALGPGMRAITVPVNASSSVAGFVFPGDHVDMVLTQTGQRRRRRPAAQGLRDDHPQPARARHRPAHHRARTTTARPRSRPSPTSRSKSTPRIAEKIAVAQSLGSLSLSLRSIADNTAELERAVASGDVKVPAGCQPGRGEADAARHRQPADRQQHDLHDRRRRVALPAPHRARSQAGDQMAQACARVWVRRSAAAAGVPTGPVVRVARGNNVTVVPVGAR